jgi:hypothetical protein
MVVLAATFFLVQRCNYHLEMARRYGSINDISTANTARTVNVISHDICRQRPACHDACQ